VLFAPLSHLTEGLTLEADRTVSLEASDDLISLSLLADLVSPHHKTLFEETASFVFLEVHYEFIWATLGSLMLGKRDNTI